MGAPTKQGLYDPQFEKDGCGMGFVANIKGKKSHDIITQALVLLRNLEHRGGQGADLDSGDGAGILLQVPHSFFADESVRLGFSLPEEGQYGVGMMFLSSNPVVRKKHERKLKQIIEEEGVSLIAFRNVPVFPPTLGKVAFATMPFIRQVFVERPVHLCDDIDFERKLYVIRRRAEHAIRYACEGREGQSFYISSFSCKKIVYKGMLTTSQVDQFYLDLQDERMESAMALVHSRFSTNTFPSWDRAHPYRFLVHNGEINTIRSNVNWMQARQSLLESDLFGSDMEKVKPIINTDGSDTAMFDNTLEFLYFSGRSLPHIMMMMIPEPWNMDCNMDPIKKAFYAYHSTLIEPWDGPAALTFTDGIQIGAMLDRNGLRPARYYVTKDDRIILSSEVGVLAIPPELVLYKDRLCPGKMLIVDTQAGRIISDEEVKRDVAAQYPYQQWLDEHVLRLDDLPAPPISLHKSGTDVVQRQVAFGYTYEEVDEMLKPMAAKGLETTECVNDVVTVALLSNHPQRLYSYFRQMFAQVTNPPIDAIREKIVTSTLTTIGPECNLLDLQPQQCHHIQLTTPLLSNEQFAKICCSTLASFRCVTLRILFSVKEGAMGLNDAMHALCEEADRKIAEGYNLLVLSDKGMNEKYAPIPSLLAVSGLHHHLIHKRTRTKVALLLESGEPRHVHHYATLIGYGVSAVNPYLVFETLDEMVKQKTFTGISYDQAVQNYIKAATKGIVTILSKMGISTIQSYRGAHIFEAVGLTEEFVDQYFTKTPSRIGGVGLDEIAMETLLHHRRAYKQNVTKQLKLHRSKLYSINEEQKQHLFSPHTLCMLQDVIRTGDSETYEKFATHIQQEYKQNVTIRSMLKLKSMYAPISLNEVEPEEQIIRRFKTATLSEDDICDHLDNHNRKTIMKSVSPGRFGVTSHFLVHADELEIKMAPETKSSSLAKSFSEVLEHKQSGRLQAHWFSSPPHYDIYSIEDLAQLIYDLKNANPHANVNVKLVAESGIGTIAAGVAKARADTICISGCNSGIEPFSQNPMSHAGVPWELGLAEIQQTLMLNHLRDRVIIEANGPMLTGHDVVIATMLGAEQYDFSAVSLLQTSAIKQNKYDNPDLSDTHVPTTPLCKREKNDQNFVSHFIRCIIKDVRKIMAHYGFRSINDMVGRVDGLEVIKGIDHWKAKGIDLSGLLHMPGVSENGSRHYVRPQYHCLDDTIDAKNLLPLTINAFTAGSFVEAVLPITNTNRAVGTLLGNYITQHYGKKGLPKHTIRFTFVGSAGQSFGAFIPQGMTLTTVGDCNDYVGKGLSGGVIIAKPSPAATFEPGNNVIVGNTAFYGATSGEGYICGIGGERFGVRNSGATIVVEGVGDHGCEYMTGGCVIVLGKTGRNFAAGMLGGIVYVYDEDGRFAHRCNQQTVVLEWVSGVKEEQLLRRSISDHVKYTNSRRGQHILDHWEKERQNFIRIVPQEW